MGNLFDDDPFDGFGKRAAAGGCLVLAFYLAFIAGIIGLVLLGLNIAGVI